MLTVSEKALLLVKTSISVAVCSCIDDDFSIATLVGGHDGWQGAKLKFKQEVSVAVEDRMRDDELARVGVQARPGTLEGPLQVVLDIIGVDDLREDALEVGDDFSVRLPAVRVLAA